MEPTTLMTADRISASALTTQGMPLAQRAIRAGLKPITEAQMRERFACDAVEQAQNKLVREKLVKDFREAKGLTEHEFLNTHHVEETGSLFRIVEWNAPKKPKEDPADIFSGGIFSKRSHHQMLRDFMLVWNWDLARSEAVPTSARKKTCSVQMEKLDHYAMEIPDRVLSSYTAAKELGFENFLVAYPVLEDAPRPDPILLAKLGDHYWEIDCWE